MMRDAESGKIRCIVVKDMSRFGRNMIDSGYYIEVVFPKLGIRLISITDNYDTDSYEGGVALPLANLMNEVYALDIGRKRRSQARQAMHDGVYVGGHPPYGYLRSSDDRRKLIVDGDAASVVKRIFEFAAIGVSSYEIACKLNTMKISPPAVHKNIQCSSDKTSSAGHWYARTIDKILENEIYIGNLIQGKTKTVNFRRKPTSSDEWISAYDVHERIIADELFWTVQSVKQEKRKNAVKNPRALYTQNIYKGIIYCAHCGGHMERRRNHNNYVYCCVSNRTVPGLCDGNRVREDAVNILLSEQLIKLKDELSERPGIPMNRDEIISELRFLDMDLLNMQDLFRGLFEKHITGDISQSEFLERKKKHQTKTDKIEQRVALLQRMLDEDKRSEKHKNESLQILNTFADTLELLYEHTDRFVSRMVVFRDGRVHFDFVV
jgi:DNA invertase Pin-like site-specific DNA recombinase